MDDSEHSHYVTLVAVCNNIEETGKHQLACSFYASGPTDTG